MFASLVEGEAIMGEEHSFTRLLEDAGARLNVCFSFVVAAVGAYEVNMAD